MTYYLSNSKSNFIRQFIEPGNYSINKLSNSFRDRLKERDKFFYFLRYCLSKKKSYTVDKPLKKVYNRFYYPIDRISKPFTFCIEQNNNCNNCCYRCNYRMCCYCTKSTRNCFSYTAKSTFDYP